MEQAEHNSTTRALKELRIAHGRARGLALGRCAFELPILDAAVSAIADALLDVCDHAHRLLENARREHAPGVAQGRLSLRAATRGQPLAIVAGLAWEVAP